MEGIKTKFLRELGDLEHLISFYVAENKLMSNFSCEEDSIEINLIKELSGRLKAFSVSKRQFNYNSLIISLYGTFERFIEDILITYADKLNRVFKSYNDLPEDIVNNHLKLSLSLLEKVSKRRYNGNIKSGEVIHNLHQCLNVNSDFSLNKDAFAQHTANFRSQVVEECFSRIGINSINGELLKNEQFYTFLLGKLDRKQGDDISNEEAFYWLDSLADRRNEVAHGVPSEILQNEIISEYVEYFRNYADALIRILVSNLLLLECDQIGLPLGEMTDLYKNGNVICIKSNRLPIKVGDFLIGKNKNCIQKVQIVEIQVEKKPISMVEKGEDIELGIAINNPFKKNYSVFLIPGS
jgi:hypothetical protein